MQSGQGSGVVLNSLIELRDLVIEQLSARRFKVHACSAHATATETIENTISAQIVC